MNALLERMLVTLRGWPPEAALLVAALAVVVVALVAHRVAIALLGRVARRTRWIPHDAFARRCGQPLRLLFVFAALRALLGAVPYPIPVAVAATVTVLLIVSIGWLAVRAVRVLEETVASRLDLGAADNLRARAIVTQIRFLRSFAIVGIVILTGGTILMSFEPLRQLGAGLLTSAGIAGVVIGFAAQRTVGNLIAGFQIAFTQPIRTDDVVIVEGEWGRIEEITLTYVVVRIWDQRRLVLPISYFIEQPFQNWTRVSAELLGSVFLHCDYRVPVDEIRAELTRLLEASSWWDGRVNVVHVTEAKQHTLEIRALVSATDSSAAWELRCEVREGLVRYLQQHHPDSLPRLRAELMPDPTTTTAPDLHNRPETES